MKGDYFLSLIILDSQSYHSLFLRNGMSLRSPSPPGLGPQSKASRNETPLIEHDDWAIPLDTVETLMGMENHRRWASALRGVIQGVSMDHWWLIERKWTRPIETTDEEVSQQMTEFQENRNGVALALRLASPERPDTFGAVPPRDSYGQLSQQTLSTFEMLATDSQRRHHMSQLSWDQANAQCLSWIMQTISPQMKAYFRPGMNAGEFYITLRKICEITPREKCRRFRDWATFVYRGSNPSKFVLIWHKNLERCRAAFPPSQWPSPGLCCEMFIDAARSHPSTNVWVESLSLNDNKTEEEKLDDLYTSFVAFESRRLFSMRRNRQSGPGPTFSW